MRIVFMGTPAFAVPSLQMLIDRKEDITGVVTQPDRQAGRGRILKPSPVKELALKYGLPVYQPEKIRNPEFIEDFKSLSPDIAVVVAYGQIFPLSLLKIPTEGFVNVHSSLLPAYRGSAPINHAIINGEPETGITIMKLNEGMDTGDIILQETTPIESDDNAMTLHNRLSALGSKLLCESLDMLEKKLWSPVPQDHSNATYAPMLKKKDGHICWDMDALIIGNHVRGMFPWPGCFTFLNGKRLKIHHAVAIKKTTSTPAGRIISISSRGIEVSTGKGVLLVKDLQLEGKRKMTAEDFIKGSNLLPGDEFAYERELNP